MPRILGTKLYEYSISSAVKSIIKAINSPNDNQFPKLISATGAHGIITAQKDSKYRSILDNFYINLPDGMSCVWIGKLKGAKSMKRCYGPDFFKKLIIETYNSDIKHYFCGGKPTVAEELKMICQTKFNNYNVVGTYSPPFRDMSDEEMRMLADDINAKETNIVWIGLSTPKQEKFAYRLSKFTNVNFICTVGAAFDFHTGLLKQAPTWLQNIGMEWFFRLIMEPKRLWKRYLTIVPLFIWYNLLEIIKGNFFKNTERL